MVTFIRDKPSIPFIPKDTLSAADPIQFHHPAYPPRMSAFLLLSRVDAAEIDGPLGVHHGTALLACQLIADNNFDGRLYTDRQGQHPVLIGLDEILTSDNYYFIIDNDHKLRYPIVPSFRDWIFPHDRIPDSWPSPAGVAPQDYLGYGNRCALTNYASGLETAHIVPEEETEWFQREAMGRYSPYPTGFPDSENRMKLRADIHRLYEESEFVIVPKKEIHDTENGDPKQPCYVAHCLGPGNEEFWGLHHNIPMQYIEHTRREMHLARFAWAIFQQASFFLLQGCARAVVTDDGNGERKVEEVSGPTLRELYGGEESWDSNLVSSSRKKRKIEHLGEYSVGEPEDDDDEDNGFGDDDDGNNGDEEGGGKGAGPEDLKEFGG